jgi:hypothetical protein
MVVQTKGGQEMPRGKKFTAEQIIGKLDEAEVGLAQRNTVPESVAGAGLLSSGRLHHGPLPEGEVRRCGIIAVRAAFPTASDVPAGRSGWFGANTP